jgi:IS30 family transposase
MERLSEREKERIAELVAARAPAWMIHKEISRSRWAIRRYINRLQRPPKPEPRRSPLRLSLVEREEILRGLAVGESFRSMADRLGRAPSTVSREVALNGGARRYRACRADGHAIRRARRPKRAKLARCPRLRAMVEDKLSCGGRRSRSRVGWFGPSLTIRRCGCPTRRSTCRCSCSPGERCARS